MIHYKFGAKSQSELIGVDTRLVQVVVAALAISNIDFMVHDGNRTEKEQAEYVKKGVSWTMASKHLKGEAVDLVPWIGGKLRWEWDPIFHIAESMRSAARVHNIIIRWGGAWHFGDFTNSVETPETLFHEYMELRKDQKRKASPDGPHFELFYE